VLALAISLLMLKTGITKLTFPFVLATWVTLFLRNKIQKNPKKQFDTLKSNKAN